MYVKSRGHRPRLPGDGVRTRLQDGESEASVDPGFSESHEIPVRRSAWPKVLLIGVVGVAAYLIFFRDGAPKSTPNHTTAPGWNDLIACSETSSLDGTKSLSLGEDGTATLREEGADGKDRGTTGKWSFDATSKRYAVITNTRLQVITRFSPAVAR
jgi:hypothetical protein